MKKNVLSVATVIFTITLSACGQREGQAPAAAGPAAGAPPPPEVNVVTVRKGSATLTQDLPGRLEAYRVSQVRARVDGIVEKRLFTEGSNVAAGQALFEIDARSYRAAYEGARVDATTARQNLERYKQLLEAKMVSQQSYDQVEVKFKQAEAALSRAQLDLENTHVPAPISGRIGRALVTEGALVGHGDATNLALVEQIDPIYANFTQSGAEVLRLQKAFASGKLKRSESLKVELVLEDGSLYPLPGKLLFSDLATDPTTGSIAVRAEFPNPRHELLPGMFAVIRLPQAEAGDSIRLPQRAVLFNQQGQYVMVVDAEGKVAPHPIKTDGMAGGDFIIGEGLQVGDRVVVDGLQKARPGTVVKAVTLDAGAAVSAPVSSAAPEKK